jgi:hypothetical protein
MATNRKLYDFPIAVASGIDDYNSVVNIFGYNTNATTAFRVLWEKASLRKDFWQSNLVRRT